MSITYPTINESPKVLKEQLRLFAYNGSASPSEVTLNLIHQRLTTRERLRVLLDGELNFHGENSSYASHDVHAFAAKFPPQLPRVFIRGLTLPGDKVLDPMMGSGTTLVEALREGRQGIGLDIDPLALRLSCVKTTPLEIERLQLAGSQMISHAAEILSDVNRITSEFHKRFDDRTKAFIDYWFLPTTQRELMALAIALDSNTDPGIRRFLDLTFSSIIITKTGGVSLALDLAHSRPHRVDSKTPKNAIEQFAVRLRKNVSSISGMQCNGAFTGTIAGDARCMPLADNVVDLVVTSPPYANAIDYMRAHKFSLVWLGESVDNLSKKRSGYVGSERVGKAERAALPDKPELIVRQLAVTDPGKAAVLRKYFVEMESVFRETYRVLREDAAAIIVVGPSTMRGLDVQTHTCLADIAGSLGFEVVGVAQRSLDRNKRMMPARFGKKGDSMIEQRMHEEYVIGLIKPNKHRRGTHAYT